MPNFAERLGAFFGGFIGNKPGGGLILVSGNRGRLDRDGFPAARSDITLLPIYWGCMTLITNRIRAMPYKVVNAEGEQVKEPKWVRAPNSYWSMPLLLANTALQILHYGNAWWAPFFDSTGRVTGLELLPPNCVQPNWQPSGIDSNRPWTVNGLPVNYPLLHLPYMPRPGDILGTGVLEAAADLLDLGRNALSWQKNFYVKGATGQFYLSNSDAQMAMNDQEIEDFQRTWQASVAGEGNAYNVPVIQGGFVLNRVSLTPEQMEYIEARKLTSHEIVSQIFNIPGAYYDLIQSGTSVTYQTNQAIEVRLWNDAVKPVACIIEEGLSLLLAGNLTFNFDEHAFLLGTPNDRLQRAAQMALINERSDKYKQGPVFSRLEIRDALGYHADVNPDDLEPSIEAEEPAQQPQLPANIPEGQEGQEGEQGDEDDEDK